MDFDFHCSSENLGGKGDSSVAWLVIQGLSGLSMHLSFVLRRLAVQVSPMDHPKVRETTLDFRFNTSRLTQVPKKCLRFLEMKSAVH